MREMGFMEKLLDGAEVEWKALGEVTTIGTGNSNRQDESESGMYPFYVRSKNVLKSNTFQFDETAIIVPDGVLFGSSNAHQQLRKHLIENNELQAVVSLPSGVFKPYAGVSTAILFITKGSRTDHVWFYDVQADGFSLDDKRTVTKDNDLPDLVAQFKVRDKEIAETNKNDRTQKAFWVSKDEIIGNKYDLSINRYKEVVYAEQQYHDPKVILHKLVELENDILTDLKALEVML